MFLKSGGQGGGVVRGSLQRHEAALNTDSRKGEIFKQFGRVSKK